MNKPVKYILIAVIGVVILYALYMSFARLIFSGAFNKRYTREEVQKHFVQHEKDFFGLVNYFDSIMTKGKHRMVTFGLGKKNTVNLTVIPFGSMPLPSGKNFIGGHDLNINSLALDSVLNEIGWTEQHAIVLMEKLSKTNCQWIRTTEFYGNPIEIYYKESGMGSFSYYVFEQSLTDSLKRTHGNPVSETNFGSRVVIKYSSAL